MKEYRKFTKKEEYWINDFKKVMANAPKSLFMFVGSGSVVIYPLEGGCRYMTEGGSVDGCATNLSIKTKMDCDGGDW